MRIPKLLVNSVLLIAICWSAAAQAQTLSIVYNPSNFSNLQNVTEWTASTPTTVTVTASSATTILTVTVEGQYFLSNVPTCTGSAAGLPCSLSAGGTLTFQVEYSPNATTGNQYGGVAVGYGNSGNPSYVYGVLPGNGKSNTSLAITSFPAMPAATNGIAYSQPLTAAGGTGTLTWSKVSGTLPAGLSLHPGTGGNGVLSGTPTCTSTCLYNFTLQVKDASGHTAQVAFNLTSYPVNGSAQCAMTSVNVPGVSPATAVVPINDLGTQKGQYCPNQMNCFDGGFYGNFANTRSDIQTGINIANNIATMESSGTIVLLAVGFSNPNLEFNKFMGLFLADTTHNKNLKLVNVAHGSQGACCLNVSVSPNSCATNGTQPCSEPTYLQPGGFVDTQLTTAGVTESQVAAIWLKETNVSPTKAFLPPENAFPGYITDKLQPDLDFILTSDFNTISAPTGQIQFKNLGIVYLASRTYAGYSASGDTFNPETYSYETSFGVQGETAKSIAGGLPSGTPWFDWGPYFWANGMLPRSDGLTWTCQDVMSTDGRHPSDPVGQMKAAVMLLNYFKNSSTTAPWFNSH